MAGQAAPIEELMEYKKSVLRDDRRDSRIRGSIENTLEFLAKRRSGSSSSSRSSNSGPNDAAGSANSPSKQYLPNYAQPLQISRPIMAPTYTERDYVYGADMEKNDTFSFTAVSLAPSSPSHTHHAKEEPTFLTWGQRLEHFTWAWFASTMSTGGVALTMSAIPNRFNGLTELGTSIFIINIGLFLTFSMVIIARFACYPHTLKHSFTNPHEGFFTATFLLTFATMINNSVAYGVPNTGPWLVDALRIAFYIYTLVASILAIGYYFVLFTFHALVITNVLPGWVLPIFPAMLVGTLASAIAKTQTPENAVPMLLVGLTYQGLGFLIALAMYGIFFGRLMTSGLPADASRPAIFIAVGPPSFTALAFIGMAQDVRSTRIFDTFTLQGVTNVAAIPDMLELFALLSAVFLWAFALWFFAIAFMATMEAVQRNNFHLNWHAYVFPNVGFTIATIRIGERLQSSFILGVGTTMGVLLFFLWLLVVFCHIKAVITKQIVWPGKDEDSH